MLDKTVKKHKEILARKINDLIDACKEAESALAKVRRFENIVEVNLFRGWGMRVRMECEGLLQRLSRGY